MSAHTPGPWRYWTQRRELEDTCTFQSVNGHEVLRAVTVTLTEADARLIAAAPELLRVLQEVVEFWDAITMEDCVNNIHAKARYVISKATGDLK